MYYSTYSNSGDSIALILTLCFYIATIVISLVWWAVIYTKAGYSGCLSAILVVLTFVPVVNLVVLLFFAVDKWPVQKELDELKASHKKKD